MESSVHHLSQENAPESRAQKPRKEWDVSKRRWNMLGFQESMSLEQARARVKQLNARLALKRGEIQIHRLEDEEQNFLTRYNSAIPELFKIEFEMKFMHRRPRTPAWRRRFLVSWRATQRMLTEIQIDPMDWSEESHLFYDYFWKNRYSFSYIKKILLITNLWGRFISRRLGQPFTRIPIPRDRAHPRLKHEHFNWLYLSIWLGLRPQEVDQLKDERMIRLQTPSRGKPVLWVYQLSQSDMV